MESSLGILPIRTGFLDFAAITQSSTSQAILRACFCALVASGVAVAYSEILYCGTRWLYRRGKLLRYYPLPKERHLTVAYSNALAFIGPTAVFAALSQRGISRSWSFNPFWCLGYTALYLVIHDVYFYQVHSTLHKLFYSQLHAMHHEHTHALNVYMVGYAEMVENFLQVGVPWMFWTHIAGSNWWYWLLPLSLIVFTTLVGHSGYKMNPSLAVFHPLIIPFIALTGNWMLTPGDHQVHHGYRRYNFGLFWRVMDKWNGTYRKNNIQARDVDFWTEWLRRREENLEESQKWMKNQVVTFEEVEWGF